MWGAYSIQVGKHRFHLCDRFDDGEASWGRVLGHIVILWVGTTW